MRGAKTAAIVVDHSSVKNPEDIKYFIGDHEIELSNDRNLQITYHPRQIDGPEMTCVFL
jgi:hypothetical protein